MESLPRLCFIILFFNIFILGSLAFDCYTSLNERGTCDNIRNCPTMLEIMSKQPSQREREYLQNSRCNVNPREVIICCPERSEQAFPDYSNPENHPLLPDNCRNQFDYKIAGGELSTISEFPWMALLEYETPEGNKTACGGSLINNRYVLTAAHCLKSLPEGWTLKRVRLGEYNTLEDQDCKNIDGKTYCAAPIVTLSFEEEIVYGNFRRNSFNYQKHDIALLRLEHDITFTNFIYPICLPQSPYLENSLLVAGWGKTEKDVPSDILLKATIPLMSMEDCKRTYNTTRAKIGLGQFCAGDIGLDTCKGDSGGPVMSYRRSKWEVVGISSFGFNGCAAARPSVYTKVYDYIPWILRNLRP